MTKQEFLRHAIISITLTVIISAIVIAFFAVFTPYKYPIPNEDNTYYKTGTVEGVYFYTPRHIVAIELTDGTALAFVYPWFVHQFYSHIGYNFDELSALLEGKTIECRAMNTCPWLLEVYVDDIVIDNIELTEKQIIATWIGAGIITILCISLIVCFEILYLRPKYKLYQKEERKRLKRVMREIQKQQRRNKIK